MYIVYTVHAALVWSQWLIVDNNLILAVLQDNELILDLLRGLKDLKMTLEILQVLG